MMKNWLLPFIAIALVLSIHPVQRAKAMQNPLFMDLESVSVICQVSAVPSSQKGLPDALCQIVQQQLKTVFRPPVRVNVSDFGKAGLVRPGNLVFAISGRIDSIGSNTVMTLTAQLTRAGKTGLMLLPPPQLVILTKKDLSSESPALSLAVTRILKDYGLVTGGGASPGQPME